MWTWEDSKQASVESRGFACSQRLLGNRSQAAGRWLPTALEDLLLGCDGGQWCPNLQVLAPRRVIRHIVENVQRDP